MMQVAHVPDRGARPVDGDGGPPPFPLLPSDLAVVHAHPSAGLPGSFLELSRRYLARAEDSDDEYSDDWSSPPSDDDDDADSAEGYLEAVHRRAEADDPSFVRLELGFDGYVPPDGDWARCGAQIGKSEHLRELILSDLDDGALYRGGVARALRGAADNRSLRKLTVRRCGVADGALFRTLAPMFRANERFERLRIDGCEAEPEGMRALTWALGSFCSLREFELSGCGIDGDGSVVKALAGHPELTKLVLRANPFGRSGCVHLSQLLANPKSKIATLSLADNGFDDECFAILSSGLAKNRSLRYLDLRRNRSVAEAGWRSLFAFLASPACGLEKLSLQEAALGDASALALANALARNRSLETVILSCCHEVASAGWTALFEHLRSASCALRELRLIGNGLGGGVASSLAHSLIGGRSLRTLDLSANCNVDGLSWRGLSSALCGARSSLDSLDLSYNQVDDGAVACIANSLVRNNVLRELKLRSCPLVTTDGWRALSNVLRSPGSALERLDLSENYVNCATTIALTTALAENDKLTELLTHFMYWNVKAAGWRTLANVLCDPSSVAATHGSNHVLGRFCPEGMRSALPPDVRALLELNRDLGPRRAARRKILKCHFGGEESLDLRPFARLDAKMLPHAVAWMAKDFEESDNGVGAGLRLKGMSLLYKFLRNMHLSLDVGTRSKLGPSRKRRKLAEGYNASSSHV